MCALLVAGPSACTMSPDDERAAGLQTIIWKTDEHLCIRMKRRKNMPKGSGTLRRRCCCRPGSEVVHVLCPVHTLWPYLATLEEGQCPWSGLDDRAANAMLRAKLAEIDIADAGAYNTHDIRRGHAEVRAIVLLVVRFALPLSCFLQDMRRDGHPLHDILKAGQWRSCAFLDYLDKAGLEEDVVFHTAIDEPLEWIE